MFPRVLIFACVLTASVLSDGVARSWWDGGPATCDFSLLLLIWNAQRQNLFWPLANAIVLTTVRGLEGVEPVALIATPLIAALVVTLLFGRFASYRAALSRSAWAAVAVAIAIWLDACWRYPALKPPLYESALAAVVAFLTSLLYYPILEACWARYLDD